MTAAQRFRALYLTTSVLALMTIVQLGWDVIA